MISWCPSQGNLISLNLIFSSCGTLIQGKSMVLMGMVLFHRYEHAGSPVTEIPNPASSGVWRLTWLRLCHKAAESMKAIVTVVSSEMSCSHLRTWHRHIPQESRPFPHVDQHDEPQAHPVRDCEDTSVRMVSFTRSHCSSLAPVAACQLILVSSKRHVLQDVVN